MAKVWLNPTASRLTGAISTKTSDAIAEGLAKTIVEPPFELTAFTLAFQQKNGRWPRNYAELCSFSASETGSVLINYDHVDFTQKTDGSLKIYAVAHRMVRSPSAARILKANP